VAKAKGTVKILLDIDQVISEESMSYLDLHQPNVKLPQPGREWSGTKPMAERPQLTWA
jgi:hypothetical protein